MVSEMRWRLRESTAAEHQDLESRLDIFARIGTLAGRREIVARFHSLHAGAEAALSPVLTELAGLDFEVRRRTPHLQADLAALGVADLPRPTPLLPLGSVAEALGLLYVLEGSTLGGKTIRREVEGQGGDMTGLSFLDPYGADGGGRWRGFLDVLERETPTPPAAAACVAGARSGFRHAQSVLCECEPVAS